MLGQIKMLGQVCGAFLTPVNMSRKLVHMRTASHFGDTGPARLTALPVLAASADMYGSCWCFTGRVLHVAIACTVRLQCHMHHASCCLQQPAQCIFDLLCASPLAPLDGGASALQYHGLVALRASSGAVISGMDVAKKIEAVGSGSGKPSKPVIIVDSGELTHFASDF